MPVLLRHLLAIGPANPIAVRLVQNGSRRMKHLYVRSAYLGVLIIVLLWALLIKGGTGTAMSYRDLAAAGAFSFTSIAYLQIGLICILAPVFMASAIAQESNPRTWEVLLTTPLSGVQIVLGNLFGRLFFVIALLFASLPLFALTQYFGGVPGRSIMASYLIAACAALLVGATAIALSVSRLVGKRAVFTFYIGVISYLAVTIALDRWIIASGGGAGAGGIGVTWFTAINPFLALHALLNPSTYARAAVGSQDSMLGRWFLESPVTAWCVGSSLLSVILMLASTITVRTGGLNSITVEGSGVPWYRRMFGLGASGAEHRPPRAVWNNPIAWREAAARNSTLGRILLRWAFIAAGALFGLAMLAKYHFGTLTTGEFRFAMLATIWGMLVVTALVAMNMAATAISREREDGTLDLLLTTPITPGQYLSGKLRGLIAYILPMIAVPCGLLIVTGVYVLFGGLGRDGGVTEISTRVGPVPVALPIMFPEAAILAPLVLLPFMAFCCMVGLQWSLRSKGTIGSVVATVAVVGIISGIIGLCAVKSGDQFGPLGPALTGLSPASLVFSLLSPEASLGVNLNSDQAVASARVSLAFGSLIACMLYSAAVYGIHANMVRTFDMTVRRLAGNR
ncbi:MAG: ABC transporter permease subunit [Phycisphaeraceae bacterium]|nr:ABC transporter permease subunit [Phycisphaerae bacterium]MBX3391571.1 ABC transporter permease subunit [Phycisphaeraceae bacterium]